MRMPILAAALPAFLLAGCSANPDDGQDRIYADEVMEEDTSASPTPALPDNALTDPAVLAGEYRVAGAGGGEIDLPHAITASISSDTIDVVSGCVRMRWSYRLAPGLVTQSEPVERCERALMPEEIAVEAGLGEGGPVRRTEQNGIQIGTGQTSVTLFSQ